VRLIFAEAMAPGQIYRASPMSLLYAVAPLYRRLHEGAVLDTKPEDFLILQPRSLDEVATAVQTIRPTIVGFSVTTASVQFAREAARLSKSIDPRIQTIFGGPHFDGLFAHYASSPAMLEPYVEREFDLVISGEAENVLARVIELAAGTPARPLAHIIAENVEALQSAEGTFSLWWRQGDRLAFLASLPPKGRHQAPRNTPPRELIPLKCEYQFDIFQDNSGARLRTAQVLTYRGCLFAVNPRNACSYCFVGNGYSPADLTHTICELRSLRAAVYRAVFFDDAIFT
jgi:hypothetical protein